MSSHRLSYDKSEIKVEACPGEAHGPNGAFHDNCMACMGCGWGIIAYDTKDPGRRKLRATLGRGVRVETFTDDDIRPMVRAVLECMGSANMRPAAELVAKARADAPAPEVVGMVNAVLICAARGVDLYPDERPEAKAERAVRAALGALGRY